MLGRVDTPPLPGLGGQRVRHRGNNASLGRIPRPGGLGQDSFQRPGHLFGHLDGVCVSGRHAIENTDGV